VLVVEDEADSRELICALLGMAGADVLCVESVAEAMAGVYRSFDPDVVLTDFAMPGENGFDMIRQFRQAPSARTAAVPILVLSGYTAALWREEALAAGAEDVLIKPFDPDALITRIADAVAAGRSGSH
jgi:CheY-like chemotaxis protein